MVKHDSARNHQMMSKFPPQWVFLPILLLMLSACTSQGNQPELSSPTQVTPTATPQINVTPSPTPIPLGTEGNPVTMGLIWSDEGEQSPAAAKFIQYLADSTGFVFALLPFDNTLDLITAMDQGAVSFAWLQPEAYLYASENNIASVAYITSHYGLYAYGSSVYVREGSGFRLNFDSDTGTSKLTASAALRQFSQKVPCLVNQHSISGYAYPLGLLAIDNIQVKSPVLLQTHEAVIRAIYTGGICDFGFTYGISGDPRTASSIQTELPDVMEKVKISWQSPADIPSLNLSYATLLAGDVRFAISTALESFVKEPDGLQTLGQMNNYSIDGIRPASDSDYEILRSLLQSAGIEVESLISQ